jgi:hypothetical protein
LRSYKTRMTNFKMKTKCSPSPMCSMRDLFRSTMRLSLAKKKQETPMHQLLPDGMLKSNRFTRKNERLLRSKRNLTKT